MKALWLAHAAATLTMFGVIWMVQIVHYPLFSEVGAERFPTYEARHQVLITWIVLPAMAIELITGLVLCFRAPGAFPGWALWLGLALIGVIWLSTAFVQVPLHSTLAAGFEPEAHRRLVLSNWIRTAAWSVRCGLVLWLSARIVTFPAG